MRTRKGGCLCGSVTYTLSAEPLATRICWCRDCQYIAANGTVNILASTDALEVRGKTSSFTKVADSGNTVERRFCPQCGVHLFSNSAARPQFTVIRVGTLEDPASVKPTVNIWAQRAPLWACMDTTLERVEGQPIPPRPAQS